jgi:hypothetical protein
MPIPESQLETWASQGSVTQSRATYATIKNALLNSKALYASKRFDVFLQGSYANDTNIYGESDVDAVIRLDAIMRSDVSKLPPEQQAAYHEAYDNATYTFDEFKDGVSLRLANAFGANQLTPGNKAFKVAANDARRSADVVACYQYRRYVRFVSRDDYEYVPGIIIPRTPTGDIINYPKLHSENCTKKHQGTNEWFKPVVRIVKNMRSRLVDDGLIAHDTACNYFIEGLLYNVPIDRFGSSYGDTFCNAINWLRQSDRSKLRCVNEQYWLLGNSNIKWESGKCELFLNAVAELWKNW